MIYFGKNLFKKNKVELLLLGFPFTNSRVSLLSFAYNNKNELKIYLKHTFANLTTKTLGIYLFLIKIYLSLETFQVNQNETKIKPSCFNGCKLLKLIQTPPKEIKAHISERN